MTALLLSLALAQDMAPQGHRFIGWGGGHSVTLSEGIVLGRDGGTAATRVATRVDLDPISVDVTLPFATYRTATGRATDLGNLSTTVWLDLGEQEGGRHAAGLTVVANPGGQPYTWVNRPEEFWPGGGLEASYQLTRELAPGLHLMGRGSLGVFGSRGYEPLPAVWGRLTAVGAIEKRFEDRFGVVAEGSLAYWDVSPMELSSLAWAVPLEGLEVRGGLVFPVASWMGWNPVGLPSGVREMTVVLQMRTAL